MLAIIDYNIGNVRSVQKAMEKAMDEARFRQPVILSADPKEILQAHGVILPGVGAFGSCISNLERSGLDQVVLEVVNQQTPLLGICVGMQMLFESSDEMGKWSGLGLLPGRVRRFDSSLRVPQIGWNQLNLQQPDPLLEGIIDGSYAYFVHSYFCDPDDHDDILTTTDYGLSYASMVRRGRIWGIQCHPEKSQRVGLRILSNFIGLCQS